MDSVDQSSTDNQRTTSVHANDSCSSSPMIKQPDKSADVGEFKSSDVPSSEMQPVMNGVIHDTSSDSEDGSSNKNENDEETNCALVAESLPDGEDWDKDIETNYGQFEDIAGVSGGCGSISAGSSAYEQSSSYHYYLPAEDHVADIPMGWRARAAAVAAEQRECRYRSHHPLHPCEPGQFDDDDSHHSPPAVGSDDDDVDNTQHTTSNKCTEPHIMTSIKSFRGMYFSK